MKPLRVAVLDDWDRLAEGSKAIERLRRFAEVQIFTEPVPRSDLPAKLRGVDAVIPFRERTRLDAALLESLPDLRHIAQTGSGIAHIDLPAATQRGVAVSVTPGGSAQAVAELTMGLLLAVVHRIGEGDRAIRSGKWPRLIGGELAGKTLGLMGMGQIGQEMAPRARAFGMNLLAWSPNMTPQKAEPYGATAVTLDELVARSDVLSIHLRLSPQTKGLLNLERLRKAKRGAILLNTSRGPIAPEPDLVAALREGVLGGAGLDVFDEEPLPPESPLRTMESVLLTPHVGWTTRETVGRFLSVAVSNIEALNSGTPTNLANPAALEKRSGE